jgi:hypothetical protein
MFVWLYLGPSAFARHAVILIDKYTDIYYSVFIDRKWFRI